MQEPVDMRKPSEVTDEYWVSVDNPHVDPVLTPDCGKWLVYVPAGQLDLAWSVIRDATLAGRLGYGAKASTALSNPNAAREDIKVICVYTADGEDLDDAARVAWELYQLGWYGDVLNYKKDQVTTEQQYAKDGQKGLSRYSVSKHHFAKCTSWEAFLAFFRERFSLKI